MGSISVVNKYHLKCAGENDFYIGRGSPLGNPYPITATMTRTAAINGYEVWLKDEIEDSNLNVIRELHRIADRYLQGKDVRLVCFCNPKPCHGHVIRQVILDAIATECEQR
jgi:hypothetical protein